MLAMPFPPTWNMATCSLSNVIRQSNRIVIVVANVKMDIKYTHT